MSIIGKIVGLFTTDTTQWTKGIKDASKDVDGLENRFTKFMDKLKGDFGKRSGLGELTELAIGRGAVKGLAEAAKAADEFTKKIVDIQIAQSKAGGGFDDYAVNIAKALPIIGSVTDAIENILKLVDGQAVEEAKIKAIVDEQNAALEIRNAIIRDGTAAQKDFSDQLRKWSQEHLISGMGEEWEKGIGQGIVKAGDAARKTEEEFRAAMKKINEDMAKNSPDLKAVLDKSPNANLLPTLQKQLSNLKAEQADAQKELADAQKPFLTTNGTAAPYLTTDKGAVDRAQSKLDDITKPVAELQERIATAKKQQDALFRDSAAMLNSQSIDLAQSVGSNLWKSFSEPIENGIKKYDEFSDKVKKGLDEQHEQAMKQQKERDDEMKRAQEKMAEEGNRLMEESNPLKAYTDKIMHLKELLDSKDIDKGTFDDQAKKALASMDQGAGGKDQGYKAASTEIRRHADIVTAAPAIASPLNDLNKKAQLALKEAQQTNKHLASVKKALGNRVTVTI